MTNFVNFCIDLCLASNFVLDCKYFCQGWDAWFVNLCIHLLSSGKLDSSRRNIIAVFSSLLWLSDYPSYANSKNVLLSILWEAIVRFTQVSAPTACLNLFQHCNHLQSKHSHAHNCCNQMLEYFPALQSFAE